MSALCRGVLSVFCNILDDVKSHINITTITPTYYTPRALTAWGKLSFSIVSLWFPLDSFSQACDYLELQRRYPHLHLPFNLFHLQQSWTESFPLDQPLPLRGPCHFHVGSNQPESQADVCESTDEAFTVRVRVPLFRQIMWPCKARILKNGCVLSTGSVVFYAVPWGLVLAVL